MLNKDELRNIFTPEQYQVELFKELGFIRKKCENCVNYFWGLNPDRKTCGETECEGGYKFISRKGPNWDFHKTISNLSMFFEKNGHTAIDAYPVVARWRDDLEFTIASIATLQPYVTSGIMPPPANPLIIPQPCLRFGGEFNDLDNIGRTGRHLSSFVMFGQLAFTGKKQSGGYWMDKCIELNFKFLTEELQIEKEELTYTENIWKGGGNFGPNLESMAYGSEIVNSVFMQYENLPNGKYKEMDLKVIDVGWGVERVSWFSQGTPTIYEATFGSVWDYLLKQSGLQYDRQLFEKYSVQAGLLDINDAKDIKSTRSNIASNLGMTLKDLNDALAGIEALYALGDHARTFTFAVVDGAIPSNVGGGYNVRTILRRMFTLNQKLNLNLDITELINRTLLYLSISYPRMKEVENILPTLIDVEKTRYEKTIISGTKYVKSQLKSKKSIDSAKLLEIYESRGLSPEAVTSIANDLGHKIDIPSDFYLQLGKKTKKVKGEENGNEISLDSLSELSTEPLYYQIPYLKKCKAKVARILDSGHIIFDKTIFYPTGGGQAEDHGTIIFQGNKYQVIDVKKFKNAIVHKINEKIPKLGLGDEVEQVLDWDRREALMRHHTAVHIIGGAAREVLGPHVWQSGADKTPTKARVDITHWESLDPEILNEIEIVANSAVVSNREIKRHILSRSEAESKYGFNIYQGGTVPGENLRIIEIPGIDIEACGGTHANYTGDVGYIRILGSERIQDGIVRISISAGLKAVYAAQENQNIINQASEILSVPTEKLSDTVERFFNEWKGRGKQIKKLQNVIQELEIPEIIKSAKIANIRNEQFHTFIYRKDDRLPVLISLGDQIKQSLDSNKRYIGGILGISKNKVNIVLLKGDNVKLDLNPLMKRLGRLIGGGGGGKGSLISGGGSNIEKISELINGFTKIVAEVFN